MLKFLAPILNFLFTMMFGKVSLTTEIYVTETHILVVDLVVETRLGKFAFPILHKQIPAPQSGYILQGVPGESSLDAGAVIDNDDFEDTRPA